MNKKLIRFGLLVIAITIIVCMFILQYLKLEYPVFLTQYIEEALPYSISYPQDSPDEEDIAPNTNLEFQYITNLNDTRDVLGIYFVEAPEVYCLVGEQFSGNMSFPLQFTNDSTIGQQYGRYRLRTIYASIPASALKNYPEGVELNTAQITFTNGDTLTTDIGKIILYPLDKDNDNEKRAIASYSSSSSSDGTASTTFTVKRPIKLLKLETPLLKNRRTLIEIDIDNIDIKELNDSLATLLYKKGKDFTIHSTFHPIPDTKDYYDRYSIRPQLFYQEEDGTISNVRLYNIDKQRQFNSFLDVYQYLRNREVY